MIPGRRALASTLILLFSASTFSARAQTDEEPLFPILASGIASAEVEGRRRSIEFSSTAAGPLVALEPLVQELGGTLELGPLGKRHQLTVGAKSYIFGPDGGSVVEGDRIFPLRQPPLPGGAGLLVPLDLLRETWGQQLGYEFGWDEERRLLSIARQPPRTLAVDLEAVELQGVTTLVFQFPTRPRYLVERSGRTLRIAMRGDRLAPGAGATPGSRGDGLVRAIEMRPEEIRVELGPEAEAREYELDDPFRLVVDVYRAADGAPATEGAARPRLARDTGGVQTIVVDPGHGGSSIGAQGPGGSLEKNLTLVLARTLKRRLEARVPVRVVLTRSEDVELPLDMRAALANQYKADLFISLHLNSSIAAGAQGAETYFLSLEASDERAALAAELENREGGVTVAAEGDDPLNDLRLILWDLAQTHHLAESQRIAALIQEELNLALDLRNRGVKQAPFRVLMGAAMPAVLVELGFLTNREEEQRLNDPEYRNQLVDTLVRAIVRYRATLAGSAPGSGEASR